MIDNDDAPRPLPVVLRPVDDELLSSWLASHATYYGASDRFSPLSGTNERPDSGETLRDTSPFVEVWTEAVAGEAVIERFLHGDSSFDYSLITLMRALLVHTWRPCGTNGREPAAGWALGTIFLISTILLGRSSAGSTIRPSPLFLSHSVRRSWRAFRERLSIPQSSELFRMTRSYAREGHSSACARQPVSKLKA
jgi:hypothetical protein